MKEENEKLRNAIKSHLGADQAEKLFRQLETLYGENCLKDVDLYVGGMLESGEDPGPLFQAIMLEQFGRLRDGDRFWFENGESGVFTAEEVEAIRKVTLWDVIVNASDVEPFEIQV